MADLFHSFLDFRPIHTSYKFHVVLPSKHLSSTHVYSPSSRIHRINRTFHLKLISRPSAPTPSSIDVVSTHEHSDGSLVFQFGEPGEAASTVHMEEPNVEKEIERGGINDDLVVNVLNGDKGGCVKDSSLAEVTDESNSIVVDSKNISIGEKENDLDEKLMKGATEFEFPTTASNVDPKDSSTQSIDMEDTGDTQEYLNDEQENSSMKSVYPDFDVISTHEHSDGSIIFRFGDLSESASNAQLEESKVEKDIEEEGTEEDNMVTDLNGDDDGGVRDSSLAELADIAQKSILVSESTEDDDNVNDNIVESSGNQVMEMEPTKVSIKSQEIQMTDFVLSSGAALLPHPSKVLTGGEDAYFVTGQTWLGVADGVGQWSFEGTNPGVYAQELIKNCEKLALDCNSDSICNPTELLKLSVGETQSPGSSTVLLAQLVGQVLQVANIGDSGFIILRHGSVYKRSSPMLHVFHFPLQIERGDDPSNLAEFYRIDLEEEDVIILASDGLLDNLYDQEITSEVSKYLAADCKPKEIAEALAAKAQEVGKSVTARSPFADNAQAAGYAGYTGGKLDDVTVIVSVVQRQSSSQTL
ncbi:uncharacterized protein [Primulina huaijiensis]|uniref:uncharacterized protein isoform X4 n=1 Tax=Primulina huaijiensis TaxID=1492673 RepID=UPI003CC70259